ncbi:MAG TPA: PQQ-dependent sugar dehydrogenase [Candidatus Binatia bacterium]|jgi:glucose/arabinose dehydrogenase
MKTCIFFAAWLMWATACFAAPSVVDPSLRVKEIVSGLNFPTTMAFVGANDVLVLEKNGNVMRVLDGVLQPDPVLDLAVETVGEHGLLGIALHPDFENNHFVYIFYSERAETDAANKIFKYTWQDGALIDPVLILSQPYDSTDHVSGIILFGPDGKLYVVLGDQNHNGQLQNFPAGAPDDTSVILRLNDDGSTPPDNPFAAQGGALARYYAYGIRNSFGMAFDPATGKLWDTENGVDDYDEVNLVLPGFNSGWESIMGPDARSVHNAPQDLFVIPGSHYADPKFSWLDTVGPTAIAFLDSSALGAQYRNDAFVGAFKSGALYHFEPNAARDGFVLYGKLADGVGDKDTELAPVVFGSGFASITDVKVGPDGLLYLLDFLGGTIYRIEPVVSFGVAALPNAEAGAPYDVDLHVGGGSEPYVVSVAAGSPPPGIAPAGTHLNGTPTAAKKFTFSLLVTDAGGGSSTRQFSLQVLKPVTISTTSLKRGKAGKSYKAALKATGGNAPLTWSVSSGGLPVWAHLDPATGAITGNAAAGVTSFTVQVIDSLGGSDTQNLTLTVN